MESGPPHLLAHVDRAHLRSPALHRVRQVGLVLAMLLVTAYFLSVVNAHQPIEHWLLWTFAQSWAFALLWAAGCLSTGHALLRLLLGRVLPIGEQITLSFAVGTLAFFVAMFVTGLARLYRPPFFFALPLVFLAAGAPSSFRYGRRLVRHLTWRNARPRRAKSPLWLVPLVFGVLSVALLYFSTFSAENVAYDARWYHLGIAEHYVASRGVVRFREGWFLGTYPHLASYLYTWALQLPGSDLYSRLQLASHVEVVVFLFTLGGVPVLVRRLVPGIRAPLAWTALFLFPGIFIYDANLNLSADHIAALWPIPIYLALLRVWRSWSRGFAIVLAALLAGALNTKYTAIIVALLPLLAFAIRAVTLGLHRRSTWVPIVAALATGTLLTAPHWAKNWIWYGDPIYPTAHALFSPRPWTADCVVPFENWFLTTTSHPPRSWEGVVETLRALFTYSFVPNDWEQLHGTVPVFGSLFTLAAGMLPFLTRTRRLWGMFLAVHMGLFGWYWIHHFDRYLQTLLPWMTTAVVGVVVLAWRRGLVARIGVVGVLGAQLAWGLGVIAIPSHALAGDGSAFHAALRMLAQGYKKEYSARDDIHLPYPRLADEIPRGAVVLLHEHHVRLGLAAVVLSDYPGTQGGISYARYPSPLALHRFLTRDLGVTHLLTMPSTSSGADSFAGDLVYFDYVTKYGGGRTTGSGLILIEVPGEPPPEEPFGPARIENRSVAFFACNTPYRHGLYDLADLAISPHDDRPPWMFPEPRATGADVMSGASFVVHDPACGGAMPPDSASRLTLLATRHGAHLYARKGEP